MRCLFVSPWRPWPETWGAAIRAANIVRGLARAGEVDVFVIADAVHGGCGDTSVPADMPVRRALTVAAPEPRVTVPGRLWWFARGAVPRHLMGCDFTAVRQRFAAWKAPAYDLVWLFRIDSYAALQGHISAPAVLDIDDLEDVKIAARLGVARDVSPGGFAAKLKRAAARAQAARNVAVTRRFQARVAGRVAAAVVCSELDRRRLGAPNAVVVPNGYTAPAEPAGRTRVGEPPTILFAGLFPYGPNADGAIYLAREVLPRIRGSLPRVRLRLVGLPTEAVQALHDPPGITVTGFVREMRQELEQADLVAVPIRFGGGTRIKILEAFAHRIPVVATPVGAEGIEASDDREILLAASPDAFAARCVAALTDEALRRRLVEGAARLFAERYRWEEIQERVAALASAAAEGRGPRDAAPQARMCRPA